MARYFGNVVFEGAEVSDRDYGRLVGVREDAQAEIEAIVGGRRIENVYELRGERDACELCETKIGEIGTMEMLEAKDCVPPFHGNCRCYLVEIGYCVM